MESEKSYFSTSANAAQHQAITTTEGPLRIIVGPGSGKTFTLVERIVSLITEKRVAPENLLVVTFTEKAASELVTRFSNRLLGLGIPFNLHERYGHMIWEPDIPVLPLMDQAAANRR